MNVVEAAIKRIEYLFDEFPNVTVSISGGKDSTVVFWLTLAVARAKNRLPLSVMWIDQEVEWQATEDVCAQIMAMKEVRPYWFQMPMVITNNASSFDRYNNCWDEAHPELWMREKSPISIKENRYGTDRFHKLFDRITRTEWRGVKSAHIAGVRTQESPKRRVTLTQGVTYSDITWGKILSKTKGGGEHYTFYPIFDWDLKDVWKYILDNSLPYNSIYDGLYRMGISPTKMRISNLHHETAIQSLTMVQELEPDTWNKITSRIGGASTIKHLRFGSFVAPKELPPMFEDWREYALYLADNLISQDSRDALDKKLTAKSINFNCEFYTKFSRDLYNDYWRAIVNVILSSDWDFTKLVNFIMNPDVMACRYYHRGRWDGLLPKDADKNKYFTLEQRQIIWKELTKLGKMWRLW